MQKMDCGEGFNVTFKLKIVGLTAIWSTRKLKNQ